MIVVSISADCTSADCASADWSCLSIQRAAPCTPRIPFIASRFFGAQRAAQWKLMRTGLSLIIKHSNIIKTPLFQLSGRKSDQYNLRFYHCPTLTHTALSASTRLPWSTKHSDVIKTPLAQWLVRKKFGYAIKCLPATGILYLHILQLLWEVNYTRLVKNMSSDSSLTICWWFQFGCLIASI